MVSPLGRRLAGAWTPRYWHATRVPGENTKAFDLSHNLLCRVGVIGGGSARASIQGDYFARGNSLGNTSVIAKGYERGCNGRGCGSC
ncbi:MAG: hypothetical protein O3C40_10545 [Planctomycetota bacterium]|nr:hypothetical protein [Planctomycetota bacterium]